MEILEPGHRFILQSYPPSEYDLEPKFSQHLDFFKKIGPKFPYNKGEPSPGTNNQEVLRVLISRCQYLNAQWPCVETKLMIRHLRESLRQAENRNLRVKGLELISWPLEIENLKPCKICGHLHPHQH